MKIKIKIPYLFIIIFSYFYILTKISKYLLIIKFFFIYLIYNILFIEIV